MNFYFPGDRICASNNKTAAGYGTYERNGYIYASLAGFVKKSETEENNNVIIEIKVNSDNEINKSSVMVGDIITARVEIVTQKYAKCSIICVKDAVLKKPFPRAILRKEDVRATDIDRVDMYKMFRPNDIILAKVIPQIEINTYSLSTALNNSLGVVCATARSISTVTSNAFSLYPQMVPISWSEMKCPLTLVKEPRKVARVMNKELED